MGIIYWASLLCDVWVKQTHASIPQLFVVMIKSRMLFLRSTK